MRHNPGSPQRREDAKNRKEFIPKNQRAKNLRVSVSGGRLLPGRRGPKCKVETGPFAHPSLCPDPAAVAPDDPPDRGEADPRAWELGVAVKAFEDVEELPRVGHVEARPVVADEVDALPVLVPVAEFDARPAAFGGGELPGVAQEVIQRDPEQAGIALGCGAGLDEKLHGAVRAVFLELLADAPGQGA